LQSFIENLYVSQQLKVQEKSCPNHDLMLVVVVFVLNTWRNHLNGNRFDVFSDHKILNYLFDHNDLNMKK